MEIVHNSLSGHWKHECAWQVIVAVMVLWAFLNGYAISCLPLAIWLCVWWSGSVCLWLCYLPTYGWMHVLGPYFRIWLLVPVYLQRPAWGYTGLHAHMDVFVITQECPANSSGIWMFIGTNLDRGQSRSSFQKPFYNRASPTHPTHSPWSSSPPGRWSTIGNFRIYVLLGAKVRGFFLPNGGRNEDTRVGRTFIFLIEKDMERN